MNSMTRLVGTGSILCILAILTVGGTLNPFTRVQRIEITVVAFLLVFVFVVVQRRAEWYSPETFATTYFIGLTAVPALVALRWSSDFGQLRAAAITSQVQQAIVVALAGWLIGILGGLAYRRLKGTLSEPVQLFPNDLLRTGSWRAAHGASAVWAAVAIIQLTLLVVVRRAHGEAQTSYDALRALDIVSSALLTAGAALFSVHFATSGRRFRRRPLMLFAACAVIILASGERGVLLSPLLLLVAMYQVHVRRVSISKMLGGGMLLMTVFAFIQANRSGFDSSLSPRRAAEAMIVDWSSPTKLMIDLTGAAESGRLDFESGATYIASIVRLLPGIISTPLLGDRFRTADSAYRELINFTNADQGFGFAFVPEGFLNFGLPGIFIATFLLAMGMSILFSRSKRAHPLQLDHYVYFLVLAALPAGLRQNSLSFVKTVLYTAIILGLFLRYMRRSMRVPPSHLDSPSRMQREIEHDTTL